MDSGNRPTEGWLARAVLVLAIVMPIGVISVFSLSDDEPSLVRDEPSTSPSASPTTRETPEGQRYPLCPEDQRATEPCVQPKKPPQQIGDEPMRRCDEPMSEWERKKADWHRKLEENGAAVLPDDTNPRTGRPFGACWSPGYHTVVPDPGRGAPPWNATTPGEPVSPS